MRLSGNRSLLNSASFSVLAFTIACASPSMVRAAGTSASQPSDSTVGEVVVTAERRTVNLEKAPIAASVLSADMLKDKEIRTVEGLERAVPSLTISDAGQSNYMNIRGIGKNDNAGNTTSAVATYRDGIPTVSGFFNGEPYYDVQSIEVLRGPQGTFVGQNAAGGAIFVNTRDPVIDGGYHGWAELGYGNYNQFQASGAVNVPVTDTFAARLAINYLRRDSFYKVYLDPSATIKNPNHVGDQDLLSGRISLLWKPISALEVKLKIDLNDLDYNGNAFGVVPGFPGARGANLSSNPFIIGNNITDNYYVDSSIRAMTQIQYTLPDGIKLRSTTGIQWASSFQRNDDDGSVIPANGTVTNQQNVQGVFNIYSEEFSIISPDTGRFNWIVGAYFESERLRFPAIDKNMDNGFLLFDTVTRTPELSLEWTTTRVTAAAFAQISYKLTDALQLQGGVRYSHYRVDQINELGLPALLPVLRNSEQDDDATGKVALNWQLNPDHFLYAFVATGHTTGGINVLNLPDVPLSFGPQETIDYETGWKGRLFGGALHTQVGFFYNDIEHYQADFVIQGFGLNLPFFQTLNSPTQDYGVEITLQGKLGHLSYDAGIAAIHSALGSGLIFDSSPLGTTTTAQTNVQVDGKRVPYTPEVTFNFGVGYDFQLPDNATLTPRVSYSWTGEQTSNILDLLTTTGIHYQRVQQHDNITLELVYALNGFSVTGYVTNLADIHYLEAASGGGDNAYYNSPRQFGVRIDKQF